MSDKPPRPIDRERSIFSLSAARLRRARRLYVFITRRRFLMARDKNAAAWAIAEAVFGKGLWTYPRVWDIWFSLLRAYWKLCPEFRGRGGWYKWQMAYQISLRWASGKREATRA